MTVPTSSGRGVGDWARENSGRSARRMVKRMRESVVHVVAFEAAIPKLDYDLGTNLTSRCFPSLDCRLIISALPPFGHGL